MGMFMQRLVTSSANQRDILQGTQIQRVPPEGGLVSLAAVRAQAAVVSMDVFIGQRQVIEKARLSQQESAGSDTLVTKGTGPKIPKDLILDEEPAAGGELIIINLTNASGNILHYRLNVEDLS